MAKKVKVGSSSGSNVVKKVSAKQEKEESYEFVPSEFDEKAYIVNDILGTKVTLIFSLVSIIAGFCAAALHALLGPVGGFVLMAVVLAGMTQFLKRIGFDTTKIKASSMLGNYVISIFLMLCIWTLLINPPFGWA